MAAPVVPTTLAMPVPNASIAVLTERRAAQRSRHQDAARDHVERKEKHDEAQIFREHRVDESGERRPSPCSAASGASVNALQPKAILP